MTAPREVRLWIDVDLTDGADPDVAVEHMADLVGNDPLDVAPEIETINNWGWEEGP